MGKGHARNEDTYLNKGGVNEVTVVNAKDAVDKKHQQNSDTVLNNGGVYHVTASELVKNILNVSLLAFALAIETGRNFFNLIDGIIDDYGNEDYIDSVNSINQQYNEAGKYYSPTGGFDTYTKFLCSFDGENGQKSAIDKASGHLITFVGDAELSTVENKFGASSLLLGTPPNGDYITVPNHDDFKYTIESFTFDGWFKFLSSPGENMMFMSCAGGGGFQWYMSYTSMQFYVIGVGAVSATEGFSPTLNQWYHIELVRSGTSIKFFINGTQLGDTLTTSATLTTGSGTLYIGSDGLSARCFPGYIDEFRISKGIARHTSNFTPPSNPYMPTVENMTLLSIVFDSDLPPVNARLTILEEDVDSIILNTDLLAYISRDNGVTWTQAILTKENNFDLIKQTLVSFVDISGQPSDTKLKYKYITVNNKDMKIHSTSLMWD
jgi:hypothetical protein